VRCRSFMKLSRRRCPRIGGRDDLTANDHSLIEGGRGGGGGGRKIVPIDMLEERRASRKRRGGAEKGVGTRLSIFLDERGKKACASRRNYRGKEGETVRTHLLSLLIEKGKGGGEGRKKPYTTLNTF